MKKNTMLKYVPVKKKTLATEFVDAVMNRNGKDADKALSEMVNNRISAKIRAVAQTENLI